MRIISGIYKSRRIVTPGASDSGKWDLRPTSDRARETLFDVLQNRIDFSGASCLELFSGTGSFGFECISRGAESCDFVDKSSRSHVLIGKTASELGCKEQIRFFKRDASAFLSENGDKYYDIIFADPPYNFAKFRELTESVLSRKFGVFVLESGMEISVPVDTKRIEVISKKVGNTFFKIFLSS